MLKPKEGADVVVVTLLNVNPVDPGAPNENPVGAVVAGVPNVKPVEAGVGAPNPAVAAVNAEGVPKVNPVFGTEDGTVAVPKENPVVPVAGVPNVIPVF